MPSSRYRSTRHKRSSPQTLERLWRWGVFLVSALVLLPSNLAFVNYGADLVAQSYGLVKAGMPFIPLGFLLMLVWRRAQIQLVTLVIYLIVLPMLWILPGWGWPESRDMLFAWPGLALGMALATASQAAFAAPVKTTQLHKTQP
jgi:hypothetical protein